MKKFLLLIGMGLVLAASAKASCLCSVDATTSGWYRDNGKHGTIYQPNHFAGHWNQELYNLGTRSFEYRNYFNFDLTGLVSDVTEASLTLYNSGAGAGYDLTFRIFEVLTPFSSINQTYSDNSPTGTAIFVDLGTGPVLGEATVSGAGVVQIQLNSAGVARVNAARGTSNLVLGGAVDGSNLTGNRYLFVDYQAAPQLLLGTPGCDVPETSTYAMVGSAVALTLVFRSLKQKKDLKEEA
jgi:opacity protein-like surface antigen